MKNLRKLFFVFMGLLLISCGKEEIRNDDMLTDEDGNEYYEVEVEFAADEAIDWIELEDEAVHDGSTNFIYVTPLESVEELLEENVLTPTAEAQQFGLSLSGNTILWYKVYMEAGVTYYFESVGDTSKGDPTAKLWKSMTSPYALRACACDAGDSMNFIISYEPGISGYYYLKIRLYDQGEWTGIIKYGIK